VRAHGAQEIVYSPSRFPRHNEAVSINEPWVEVTIITPKEYVSSIVRLLYDHEGEMGDSLNFGSDRLAIKSTLPLRELMRGFFDKLKNCSSGFASLSYRFIDTRPADVARIDVFIAEEIVPAFSKIISRKKVEEESKHMVERLYEIFPRQWFATKIQAYALGRIISSKTLPALRKDVTGHLYGGDITRKRKLWEKQKKGKKKMQKRGKVTIPHDVFLKMVKGE
jgi:GTP-binding protein LepA